MSALGVYVISWGLSFCFSLCIYIYICIAPVKTQVLSQQISGVLLYNSYVFALFVCGVCTCFALQKLFHWLGTVSLKSTVAKGKMLLEVFIKLYLLKLTVNFLLFETCDN